MSLLLPALVDKDNEGKEITPAKIPNERLVYPTAVITASFPSNENGITVSRPDDVTDAAGARGEENCNFHPPRPCRDPFSSSSPSSTTNP